MPTITSVPVVEESASERMLQELMADSILRRIPDRRIRSLKQAWIRRLLDSSGISYEESDDGNLEACVSRSSATALQWLATKVSFIVIPDDGDKELLLANRAEAITYICRGLGKSPTQVITEIEGTATPLERLAQSAEE